jgi:hypothetical protein
MNAILNIMKPRVENMTVIFQVHRYLYLASGETLKTVSLSLSRRIPHNMSSVIISQFLKVIVDILGKE